MIKSIDMLIDSGHGDKGRLEHIKDSLQKGKSLYKSDDAYLRSLLSKHLPNSIENKSEDNSTYSEEPINLDELRKSQPKPKHEPQSIKFGVSYSHSGRGSVKIHMSRCRHVHRSSQEGDTKWAYFSNYHSSKEFARAKAPSQNYGWKYAECCLNGHISRVTTGAVVLSLFLGIIGALIGWYITREYYPRGSKVIFSIGTIITIIWLANSATNYLR